MSIESDLYEALCVKTAAAAAAIVPMLPIKFVGRIFTPPNDQKYWEMIQIVNDAEGETWGNYKTYRGILRLLLHWPIDDEGIIPALDVAASMKAQWPKASTIYFGQAKTQITSVPLIMSNIGNETENLVPISIRYGDFQV